MNRVSFIWQELLKISKIFVPFLCLSLIQKAMKPNNLFAMFCVFMFGLGLIAILINMKIITKSNKNYYYTIITPDRGTWYTTNNISYDSFGVSFTVDDQKIRLSLPYAVIKEVYAPTNFIDENE